MANAHRDGTTTRGPSPFCDFDVDTTGDESSDGEHGSAAHLAARDDFLSAEGTTFPTTVHSCVPAEDSMELRDVVRSFERAVGDIIPDHGTQAMRAAATDDSGGIGAGDLPTPVALNNLDDTALQALSASVQEANEALKKFEESSMLVHSDLHADVGSHERSAALPPPRPLPTLDRPMNTSRTGIILSPAGRRWTRADGGDDGSISSVSSVHEWSGSDTSGAAMSRHDPHASNSPPQRAVSHHTGAHPPSVTAQAPTPTRPKAPGVPGNSPAEIGSQRRRAMHKALREQAMAQARAHTRAHGAQNVAESPQRSLQSTVPVDEQGPRPAQLGQPRVPSTASSPAGVVAARPVSQQQPGSTNDDAVALPTTAGDLPPLSSKDQDGATSAAAAAAFARSGRENRAAATSQAEEPVHSSAMPPSLTVAPGRGMTMQQPTSPAAPVRSKPRRGMGTSRVVSSDVESSTSPRSTSQMSEPAARMHRVDSVQGREWHQLGAATVSPSLSLPSLSSFHARNRTRGHTDEADAFAGACVRNGLLGFACALYLCIRVVR